MDIDSAWNAVLGQLETEMPRASFGTWVRDTQVVSFDPRKEPGQAAILTVGARNAYARDWLESRLTSTVSRLLVGILNRAVEVRFTIFDAPEGPPDDELFESPAKIAIEPVQYLDYEEIVQPHKQIVVKGYLRRLGAEIGAKAVWLYIGFHQAAWRAGSGGNASPVYSCDVIRYSGLSESAFWRLLKRAETRSSLAGLVERVDPHPVRLYQRGRDGRPHRAPARYRVYLTPRLTHADAQGLFRLLSESLQAGKSLSQALEALLAQPNLLDELEPQQSEQVEPQFSQLHTAMDIVQVLSAVEMDAALHKLAQELHRKVVNGLGDIHIRHYFIEQVIPHFDLSPAQAWLVTVARDMAYLNWRTGERRETILFRGGYGEMAELVGLQRAKTVQEWLQPGWKAGKKGGDLTGFLTEIETDDMHLDPDWRTVSLPRRYRVSLDEPLVDADGGIKAGANGGNTVDANDRNRQTPMEAIAGAAGGIKVDANGGALNTLNTPTKTKRKTTSTTQHPLTGEKAAAGTDAPAFWELKPLLQRNLVHPKVQRELLDSQATVQAFVSWVLFACSPQAARLSEPLGYALSQLRADPETGAGGAFDRFAAMSPKDLLHLIDSTPVTNSQRYGRRSDHPMWPSWKAAMGNMNRAVLVAREILFGKGGSEA